MVLRGRPACSSSIRNQARPIGNRDVAVSGARPWRAGENEPRGPGTNRESWSGLARSASRSSLSADRPLAARVPTGAPARPDVPVDIRRSGRSAPGVAPSAKPSPDPSPGPTADAIDGSTESRTPARSAESVDMPGPPMTAPPARHIPSMHGRAYVLPGQAECIRTFHLPPRSRTRTWSHWLHQRGPRSSAASGASIGGP